VHGNDRGVWSTGATLVVTLANTPTNGNILVCCIAHNNDGTEHVTGITQTNVVWTEQKSNEVGGLVSAYIWYGIVSAGASTTVTITFSANPYAAVADICEYSGMLTTGFLDKTASASGGSNTAVVTGTTATTTQAVELWIGIGSLNWMAQTTPQNGFTLLDGAAGTSSCAYLEKIVSSTGTASSGTTGADANYWAGCMATFKGTTEAPPTTPTKRGPFWSVMDRGNKLRDKISISGKLKICNISFSFRRMHIW
jgi:hypothetical protein